MANSLASSRPMPAEAPVMRAVLFFLSISSKMSAGPRTTEFNHKSRCRREPMTTRSTKIDEGNQTRTFFVYLRALCGLTILRQHRFHVVKREPRRRGLQLVIHVVDI